MRPLLTLLVAAVLLPAAVLGQSSSIYLAAPECLNDPAGTNRLRLPGFRPLTVEIRAFAPEGATGFEFSIPGFTAANAILVVDWIPNPEVALADGNPFAEGAKISFPACQTSPVTLYSATIFAFADPVLVPWVVAPHSSPSVPGTTCPTTTPCGGGAAICTFAGPAQEFPVPPTHPFPADGAVDVPLQPSLSCFWKSGSCTCLGVPCTTLWFGVDPDPPVFVSGCDIPFPDLDLAPETTYYWRVAATFCGSVIGPIWSFTTEQPLAGEPATWSHVKRTYR